MTTTTSSQVPLWTKLVAGVGSLVAAAALYKLAQNDVWKVGFAIVAMVVAAGIIHIPSLAAQARRARRVVGEPRPRYRVLRVRGPTPGASRVCGCRSGVELPSSSWGARGSRRPANARGTRLRRSAARCSF